MRLFDEPGRIPHSLPLMQMTRMSCAIFACLALTVQAQDLQPTNQPPALTNAQEQISIPPPAPDSGEIRKTRVLTMEEAMRLALQHNLDIQITRFTPLIDLYGLNGSYSAFEPAFKFAARHTFNSSPGQFNATSGLPQPAQELNRNIYQPEIAGTLPTGTIVDITGPLTDQSGNTVSQNSKFSSSPGITLSQPILKNFWIDNNRLTILLDRNLMQSDEYGLRLKIMTVITTVKNAYYNLIAARANVKVNLEALTLAEQLVSENRKRVQVGALAPLDEKQSESQAASSHANLLLAEQTLGTDENILKNLITDTFSEWADVAPIPSESLVAVPADLDLQESWRKGVTSRPEIQQAKLAVEKQNINIKYSYNQLFPEVDLQGSYGRNAVDPTFSGTLSDISTGNNPFYSYGIVVTIPLGNVGPRNDYKKAKASQKQALLQLKQQEQTIVVAIDNDIKVIRSDLQQVDATREARIYAEAALEAEQKKLENGKSTSFIVLQLQSNLTSARSAEIAALANYNIALEQLALDEGSTLDRNHIDLQIK